MAKTAFLKQLKNNKCFMNIYSCMNIFVIQTCRWVFEMFVTFAQLDIFHFYFLKEEVMCSLRGVVYKDSGVGREKGQEALKNYLSTKCVTMPISGDPRWL